MKRNNKDKGHSEVLNKQFEYNTIHVELNLSDDLWQYDEWIIIINGEHFKYSTGIGHRKVKQPASFYKVDFEYYTTTRFEQTKENMLEVNKKLAACSVPVPPQIDDVLYSIISDASTVLNTETFEEWCDELCYDEDSRKAMDIYMACQKQVKKARQLDILTDDIIEAFQDY